MRALQKIQNHASIFNSRAFVLAWASFIEFLDLYFLGFLICFFSRTLKFLWIIKKYMHIAFVVVLFLLNMMYISSLLIPFMTYCKMLLFTKKGNNIILDKQNRSESEQQVNQGSYVKTE